MVVRLRPHNLVAMASPSARTYEIKAADAFESKLFRQGLFYRLKIVRLTMPPLRERRKVFPCWPLASSRSSAEKMGQASARAFLSGTVPLDSYHAGLNEAL